MNAREERLRALERIAAACGAATVPAGGVDGARVARRIDEGYCALIGCAVHGAALVAEGLADNEERRFRILVDALAEAEALRAALGPGGGEEAARAALVRDVLYEAAGDALGRIRARAAAAFREDATEERRRIFFSAYVPREAGPRLGRRAMCRAVELKLR
jgi:hypothetical protein